MRLTTITIVLSGVLLTAEAFGQAAATATVTNTPWDISAAAGLTLTRGNSKTLLFTGNVLGEKKWDQKNELSLGVDGVYGENSGVKNAESLHGFGQYNRLFNERLFGYLRLEGLHDAIADIKYRLTVSP